MTTLSDTSSDHTACAPMLIEYMRKDGWEVTAETEQPDTTQPWYTEPLICPHGVAYWLVPTPETITKIETGTA